MIRASKNLSLRPRRGDPAPIVIRQHETCGGHGFKLAPDNSRTPADSTWRIPPITAAAAVEAFWAVVEAKWAVDDDSAVGAQRAADAAAMGSV